MSTPRTHEQPLLIGVDGGATEVKAHAVKCAGGGVDAVFTLRPEADARTYAAQPAFVPLPIDAQLEQRDRGAIVCGDDEQRQAAHWIEATADAIATVAQQAGRRAVRVGIGMPGLKTADGRGIAAINNGPRMPDFLERLEPALAARGLVLAAPIAELGSDADYCGVGEEYASDGLFRDVAHAYYVGGGTGLADALKLDGALVPFDACPWLTKAWRLESFLGPTYEALISAKSLNAVWRRIAGDGGAKHPEAAALAGDPAARMWLGMAALLYAHLIAHRLRSVFDVRGVVLERVVIGQRVGLLLADASLEPLFAEPLARHVAHVLRTHGPPALHDAWLAGEDPPRFNGAGATRLAASRLRAAPALGAAIAAARAARQRDA